MIYTPRLVDVTYLLNFVHFPSLFPSVSKHQKKGGGWINDTLTILPYEYSRLNVSRNSFYIIVSVLTAFVCKLIMPPNWPTKKMTKTMKCGTMNERKVYLRNDSLNVILCGLLFVWINFFKMESSCCTSSGCTQPRSQHNDFSASSYRPLPKQELSYSSKRWYL